MSFVVRLVVGLAAVWMTVEIGSRVGLPLEWGGLWRALLFVAVLGLFNAFIRPLVKIVALPFTCLTFGLFAFVINALLFWVVAVITGGVVVGSFWAALFGSILLALLSGIINSVVRKSRRLYG